jgi:hypothetical protein
VFPSFQCRWSKVFPEGASGLGAEHQLHSIPRVFRLLKGVQVTVYTTCHENRDIVGLVNNNPSISTTDKATLGCRGGAGCIPSKWPIMKLNNLTSILVRLSNSRCLVSRYLMPRIDYYIPSPAPRTQFCAARRQNRLP